MKINWSKTMLIASVTFNVAVLGIFAYATAFGKIPFQKNEQHMNNLNASGENAAFRQPGWFDDYIKKSMKENKPAIDRLKSDRKDFNQTLLEDDFDESEARKALTKLLHSRSAIEKSFGESLIEMRKQMTSAQAKQLLEKRLQNRERILNPEIELPNLQRERLRAIIADSLHKGQRIDNDDTYEQRLERRERIRKRLLNKIRQNRR